MLPVEQFLLAVDSRIDPPPANRIVLPIIGSTALFLQTDYSRSTKDSDVVETDEIVGELAERLLRMAGKGSVLNDELGMYLEILGKYFPFLPEDPWWHALTGPCAAMRYFDVRVLDPTDVVIAKLPRFNLKDREDIRAMCDRDLVDADRFAVRFRSALQRWWFDARAEDFPRIVRHFHRVQTDELFVWPSAIELPPWIDAE